MNIGLDTYCYQIPLAAKIYNVFRVIDKLPSMGVKGLQVNINGSYGRFLGADPGDFEHVKKVREAFHRRGLFIEVGGRSTLPDMLEWQLALSAGLGANILRTTVTLKDTMDETFEAVRRDLGTILPRAHELGVRIALENHEDLTASELVSIIEAIDDDYLGVCLDTGNGLCVYEDPVETAMMLAPYAISSHIKDQRLVRVDGVTYSIGVRLGRGMIDLPRIIDIILERATLDRLLIQDTTGYGVRLNPFERNLGMANPFTDIPEMTRRDLEEDNLLLSIDDLGREDLESLARTQLVNIGEDISYLRRIMGDQDT